MRWCISIILALLLISSCQSHKSANFVGSSRKRSHISNDSTAVSSIHDYKSEIFSVVSDSISISFSADSVITQDMVVYRPAATVYVYHPSFENKKTEVQHHSDSARQTVEICDSMATVIDKATDSEKGSIGKPIRKILSIFALACGIVIILFWLKLTKSNSQ